MNFLHGKSAVSSDQAKLRWPTRDTLQTKKKVTLQIKKKRCKQKDTLQIKNERRKQRMYAANKKRTLQIKIGTRGSACGFIYNK